MIVARPPATRKRGHADRSHSTPTHDQEYYDRFSPTYENERHHGYHKLIDELELDLVRRYGAGKDVFEAGCGTGLLLREAARGRALGGGPRSVARDAAAGPRPRAEGRAGIADRRAAAVGVVRPRLQHEGAGARAAHRARGRRAGPAGPPGRPPAARVLQPAVAALPGQAPGRPGPDRRRRHRREPRLHALRHGWPAPARICRAERRAASPCAASAS